MKAILVVLVAILATATADLVCGPHEKYTDCGYCEPTCDNPYPDACATWCVRGCFCEDGYLRDSYGNCVRSEQCRSDVCGPNEEYTDCGGCEPSCENPYPEPCTAVCRIGCFCQSGFRRNSNGVCVRPEECDNGNGCFIDQIYVSQRPCKNTCQEYLYTDACGIRGPGCTCKQPGQYILEQTGQCVPPEICRAFYGGGNNNAPDDGNSGNQPPSYNCDQDKGLIYTECIRCDRTCDVHSSGPIACAQACTPGCDCKQPDQYIRSDGRCVPEQFCYTTNCQCSVSDYYDYYDYGSSSSSSSASAASASSSNK